MNNNRNRFVLASTAAIAAIAIVGPAAAQTWVTPDTHSAYSPGDLQNHTTCGSGALSVTALDTAALVTYGLDWFIASNSGGFGARDCRFSDPEFDGSENGMGAFWSDTLRQNLNDITINAIKGTKVLSGQYSPNGFKHPVMWRWQSILQVDYPLNIIESQSAHRTIIEAIEQNVPGHCQADVAIIDHQFTDTYTGGDAREIAQYEYLYDADEADTTGGAAKGFGRKSLNNAGAAGQAKALAGVRYLRDNYPVTSYFLPAAVEQCSTAGQSYTIADLRNFNDMAPTVAFGFVGPGHQATYPRGGYTPTAVGGSTYGGRGIYVAQIGGVWDALLGEGRNWWFFGSSDYASRGAYAPTARGSTADFLPGEYEKAYFLNTPTKIVTAADVINGLRSGNSYSAAGSLNGDDNDFTACIVGTTTCAQPGGTLVVEPTDTVSFNFDFDHSGGNKSPYTFSNPLLAQIGQEVPLNTSVLDHLDFIAGDVTGLIGPNDPNYSNPTNPTAAIYKTFTSSQFQPGAAGVDGSTVNFTMTNIDKPMYMRIRGTNIPPSTLYVTDAQGNPLADSALEANVICSDPACPSTLPVNAEGQRLVANDVEAWANVWTYVNPIYIRPAGASKLAAERATELAEDAK